MKRHLGAIVRAAVVAAILIGLVVFARAVDWAQTWRAVRATSPGLLVAAALVNLMSVVLKGVRWWIFLRPIGVPSLLLAVRGTFVGAGLNNLLIANGGEAARVVYVSRRGGVPTVDVLATLALERLFEIVGYVILLAAAVSFLHLPATLDRTRPIAMVSLVVILAFLAYLVRYPAQSGTAVVEGEGFVVRARNYARGFLRTMTTISTGPRFAAAAVVSVAVWALQVATYQLTARAAQFDISIVGTIGALLAVNIGFALRATPGNVGVFQMIYAVTAASFGLDRDQATGVAFLIQIQQILPVTLLGLIFAPGLLFSRGSTHPAEVISKGSSGAGSSGTV